MLHTIIDINVKNLSLEITKSTIPFPIHGDTLSYQTWYTDNSDLFPFFARFHRISPTTPSNQRNKRRRKKNPSSKGKKIVSFLQELSTVLVNNRSTSLGIEEKILALCYVGFLDSTRASVDSCKDTRWGQQLQGIPHADLAAMF